MSRYDNWGYGFPQYETVAEKREKALKALEKFKSKNKTESLSPVVIEGRNIAKSWWGKAWCENLESYADYSNRIDRGKSYVRNGMVIDLKISKGFITALVVGSGPAPYRCDISIKTLDEKAWNNLKTKLQNKFDSLQTLLAGEFPEDLKHVFSSKEYGFFPAPKEIKMNCSCPDYAELCKHLASVLYGVGARLDNNPELIFTLRGVDINELTSSVIQSQKKKLSEKAGKAKQSKKVIKMKDSDLSSVFGIDVTMEELVDEAPKPKRKRISSRKKKSRKSGKRNNSVE